MKKRLFKKAAAVVTSALVAASAALPMFSATVGAVEIGEHGFVTTTNDNTLVIPKGVTMRNPVEGKYCSVVIKYDYTVAPETPTQDAVVGSVQVKPGVADSITVTQQPNYIQQLVDMNQTGVEKKENIVLNVDTTKFTLPGVYRYKITENTGADELYKVGMSRLLQTGVSEYQSYRYLDVYITKSENICSVSGYVLMKNNPASHSENDIQKSVGFIASDNLGYDMYRTYNIELSKSTEGTMADKTHEFPFSITVNNNDGNNVIKKYFWAKNQTETWTPSRIADNNPEGSQNLTAADLKDGDKIYIRGLTPLATVSYTETNDTDDTYTVTVTGQSNPVDSTTMVNLVGSANKTKDQTTVLSPQNVTDYTSKNSNSSVSNVASVTTAADVIFHNKIDAVSPTGVVLRFAPFIVLAGFGVLLFAVSRRNKGRKDETDMI